MARILHIAAHKANPRAWTRPFVEGLREFGELHIITGGDDLSDEEAAAHIRGHDVLITSWGARATPATPAVDPGRLTEARIDESVGRLLRLKENLGLAEERSVAPEMVPRVVGVPEHIEISREIAEHSITLIRNGRNLLPLLGTRSARVLSVSFRNPDDLLSGRYFDRRLRETYPRLVTRTVDEGTNSEAYDDLLRRAGQSNLVVVSVYSNFAGRVDLPDATVEFVNELARRNVTHVVISFGNPYLISLFPDARAYMLAWSSAQVSQEAAAGALFGGIAISGRSPIGMDPYFAVGDGIQVPLKAGVGGR